MVTEKSCPDCGHVQPISEFTKNRARPDGLAFYCRSHARQRSRASRETRLGPPMTRHARDVAVPDGFKWCPDCREVKPLDDYPRSRSPSGRHSYCKPCHNARGRASLDKVGGSRTYHLRRRYGISAADADAMFDAQGGLCAICQTAPAVHVDHDHETGAVRALLCFNCNGGLGQFRDDPDLLRAAADYVEEHRERSLTVGTATDAQVRGRRASTMSSRRPSSSPGVVRWRAMFPDWEG